MSKEFREVMRKVGSQAVGLLALGSIAFFGAKEKAVAQQPQIADTPQAIVQMLPAGVGIPDHYIVSLRDATPEQIQQFIAQYNIHPDFTFETLQGFAAELNESQIKSIQGDPSVASIQQDGIVQGYDEIVESPAPINRDILDDASPVLLDGEYSAPASGEGTTIVIVDSGVNPHDYFLKPDGTSRLTARYTVFDDDVADCHGHGTHVAGIAAKVATDAEIVSWRVLHCNNGGTGGGVLHALGEIDRTMVPSTTVVNLSLGLMGRGFNAAVEQLVEAGFTVVAAAGNDFNDVAQYTPASADGVIAVGGAAWYGGPNPLGFYVNSNYGEEIDLLAPAFRIVSASHLNEHGEATMSGTSMAAPAVSGAAAQLIELHPGILPAQVEKYLTDTSLHIVPFVPENTTNGLLQVNTQGTGVEIDNALRETETLTYHTHISSTEGLQIETTFSESVVVESGAVITDTVPTTTTNGTFFCNNEQTSCIYVSPPGELPTEDVSMTVSQERTSGIQVDTTWSDLNRQPLEEQMDIVNFRSEVLLPLITR